MSNNVILVSREAVNALLAGSSSTR